MQYNTMTSNLQTSTAIKDVSTFLQAASPVNHLAAQVKDSERPMSAICGPKCLELFARSHPDGSFARMFSALLIGRTDWSSNRYALTWKVKATKSARSYFQLQASPHCIVDTECGSLPTPVASDYIRLRFKPEQLAKSNYQMNMRCLHLKLLRHTTFGQNRIITGLLMGYPLDWTNVPFKHTEIR